MQNQKWVEKELRLLAKQSAVAMGGMNQKSREVVRDCFALIDFYDTDLVLMLKKYKLV